MGLCYYFKSGDSSGAQMWHTSCIQAQSPTMRPSQPAVTAKGVR